MTAQPSEARLRARPAMRILYVDHADQLGGAELSLLALLRTLDRRRFQPTVACPPGRLAARAADLGVPRAEVQLGKLGGRNPLRSLRRLWRGRAPLRRLLADGGFRVLHANTLRAAIYGAAAIGDRSTRLVWHVRDADVPAWARRVLLWRCAAAIAPSQFVADRLGARRKVCVVPNGIDLADVPHERAFEAFREELGIPSQALVIGCLGRVRPWKGQAHFVDVAARLAPRLPEAWFLIVGDTLFPDPGRDYVAEVKARAAERQVADRIRFTGYREDPLAALGAMDVVVNCSLDEPFGRVLVEAMACRRPVVAFRSGAVPEIVVDGSTGLLVPPGDLVGMAEAVFDLVRNPTRAEAYGEAGRQRVAAHFRLEASTRRVEAIYDELGP